LLYLNHVKWVATAWWLLRLLMEETIADMESSCKCTKYAATDIWEVILQFWGLMRFKVLLTIRKKGRKSCYILVPKQAINFLSRWVTVSLSRRALVHAVSWSPSGTFLYKWICVINTIIHVHMISTAELNVLFTATGQWNPSNDRWGCEEGKGR